MSSHRLIRSIDKRFRIVFYQLEKVMEDWGQCRGLSANDVSELGRLLAKLKKLYSECEFEAYHDTPFIPEEEFDNEPQANTKLQLENKRLKGVIETNEKKLMEIKRLVGSNK